MPVRCVIQWHRGCALMDFAIPCRLQTAVWGGDTLLMPTGKPLLWLVLLDTVHREGLAGAEGARSPVGGEGGGHQTAQTLPISPKQVTQQPAGLRKYLFKAWPATQAKPIHQLSCRLPARPSAALAPSAGVEASNAVRQGWGLGEALGGAVCAAVMDDANRDDIPGIFILFHTSGKLFNQSSCKAPTAGTRARLRDAKRGHSNLGGKTRSTCERYPSACYFLKAETHAVSET